MAIAWIGRAVAVDEHAPQAGAVGAVAIVDLAVADMKNMRRDEVVMIQCGVKDLRVRFGIADPAGDEDLIEARSDAKAMENFNQA